MLTKIYVASPEDGTETNVTVSDEPRRSDVNAMNWEAATEGLFLRAVCRKCGRPASITETERLFLHELSMGDLPALRASSLPVKENRYLGGNWKGLKNEAFLRRYIEIRYVFFDYGLWALFRHDRELREVCFLGLIRFSPEEPPELGCALRSEARRQGYTVEAGLAALRYVETGFGFTTAKIRVVPENQTSCAVAARIEEQWDRAGGAPQCRPLVECESPVCKG